jgi:NCAIR mutase (PurE)-related protein
MKKLLTIAFAFAAFVTFASSADAQVRRNGNSQTQYNQTNNRAVRVYNETKLVWQGRQQFRETYQVSVFRNGKTVSKLISRVKVNNDRNNNAGIRTTYQTQTVRKGRYTYRETYQITTYRNGKVERKLVKSVRI